MCSPVAVGVAVTAVATVAQGYQAKQYGEYKNKVAQYNARVTENEATQVRNKGTEQENILREKTAQLISRQKAELGAANVGLTSGSALDIQENTELLGEADALRVRSNFQRQAESLESQAELTKAAGKAEEQAGDLAFTSSLLSAGGLVFASGVADKWFTPTSAAYTANPAGRPQAGGRFGRI